MDNDDIGAARMKRLAKDHWCTVREMERALDAHPINGEPDKYLRRLLALELIQLDQLGEVFREKAVAEKDCVAGALAVKISERLSTLVGLNAPQSAAVEVIQRAAPPAMNSTERIRAAIDRIRLAKQPEPPPNGEAA